MAMIYKLRQLFWESTLRCNMQCLHCGSDCRTTSETPDMPLEHFLPVLDEVKRHQPDTKTVVFTLGGEPLVRPDILKCGREITRRGFFWGMVSNGMLIDGPMMRELSRNGLASLAIDVDGMPEQHNWLRNSPVSFDRVYNAIGHIRQAPHLVWDVITCVNSRNLPHMEEMKRMLIDAGVKKWRCFTIVPMGRAKDNSGLQISDSQLRELMEFIVRTRNEGKIDLSYACEGYLGEYEGRVRRHLFRCQAGLNTASVLANGDISGCLSIRSSYTQGNIYKDSFWEVWSRRFDCYRDHSWMRTGECADCGVFDKCRGNGMHLRNDDGSLMTCHYKRLGAAVQ
ncbi:MAG TPA: radical SAM/SPASM domain-containing protein [Porphyromonadaceae bacterium]|nr:radical SAM/SPASM domain-containing protein [Porphyromonadaceae bacterium]